MKEKNFILLGATGDLSRIKIYPALSELRKRGLIDECFRVTGVALEDYTDESFSRFLSEKTEGIINNGKYISLDFKNDSFEKLADSFSKESDLIFYLSIGPDCFLDVLKKINTCSRINKNNVKIIIEKPYGEDYENTIIVNQYIKRNFSENQVFRIDHYLGKDGTKRLEELKNKEFSRWNSEYIKDISFVFSETLGIENRIDFYRKTGAVADFVQNHIFQLMLTVVSGIEKNTREDIDIIMDAFNNNETYAVPMQYLDFEKETLCYGSICMKNKRWKNVKFRFLTGKRMAEKRSEVIIRFRDKAPVVIDFNKKNDNILSEYAKLILDAINGDHSCFVTSDAAEATWRFGDNIRKKWNNEKCIKPYDRDKLTADDVLKLIK